MAADPSFDIVSEINLQEMDNAIGQATKEVITRYDFKGTKAAVDLEKDSIELTGDSEFQLKYLDALQDSPDVVMAHAEVSRVLPASLSSKGPS